MEINRKGLLSSDLKMLILNFNYYHNIWIIIFQY